MTDQPQPSDHPGMDLAAEIQHMFDEIEPIGLNEADGHSRLAWSVEDDCMRAWFVAQAESRGLTVQLDRAGNQWAWWGGSPTSDRHAITTGSHLDSVPSGGRFDGPLGVISAFLAIDQLRLDGYEPQHCLGIVNASDEEGARFGIACFGTRVLTGVISPEEALARTDSEGVSLRAELTDHAIDLSTYGADPALLGLIDRHVELHVEQGYALGELGSPVSVASHIWPHGRWAVHLYGEANHAGTTPMQLRRDPMLQLARLIDTVHDGAIRHGVVATIGRLTVIPNGVNVIPSQIVASLDIRAPQAEAVYALIRELAVFDPIRQSWTSATYFDTELSDQIRSAAQTVIGKRPPVLGTGAGHDAGVLANAGVPTAMLFVRSVTGASHTPAEDATIDDCATGVRVLAAALMMMDGRAR